LRTRTRGIASVRALGRETIGSGKLKLQ